MHEGGPASFRKGCLSSSCAVALCEGSRTSIESRKPRSTDETWSTTRALGVANTPCSRFLGDRRDPDLPYCSSCAEQKGCGSLLVFGVLGCHWGAEQH